MSDDKEKMKSFEANCTNAELIAELAAELVKNKELITKMSATIAQLQVEKGREGSSRKRRRREILDQLEYEDFAPSSATWEKLSEAGFVQDFREFTHGVKNMDNPEFWIQCDMDKSSAVGVVHVLQASMQPLNEELPTVVCAIYLSHVVKELNKELCRAYELQIYPTVYSYEQDHRKDKKADYSIIKLRNSRTVTTMEIKLSVATMIFPLKDSSAQLSVEVSYVAKKENASYHKIACLLCDTNTWHIFVLNVRHKPFLVDEYYCRIGPNLPDLCCLFRHIIVNLS